MAQEAATEKLTPDLARSIARALMVKVKKYRAPHAVLYHCGRFVIRRMTPAYRINFPEWWNNHYTYTLVGVYDGKADVEVIVDDILDTHRGEYAEPIRICIKKAPFRV